MVAAALIAPPGPEVIAALAGVDAVRLRPSGQADLLAAWERQAAWVASCSTAVVALVADAVRVCERAAPIGRDDPELVERSARCEVAAALRASENVAGHRIEVADELAGRLAMVAAALRLGELSYWQATAIVDATGQLSDDQAGWVARRVLPRARKQTLAQLRASLRRAVLAVAPHTARRNLKRAKAEQGVDWWPTADGQAELRLTADAADVKAVYDAIAAAAKQLGATHSTDSRTAGRLRVQALSRTRHRHPHRTGRRPGEKAVPGDAEPHHGPADRPRAA